MNWIIGIIFAVAAGLIGLALYWMFSPKYNTTEDYRALLPLFSGAAFFVLALIVWGATALYRHFA
jgi:hypothetical protein